MDCPHPQTKSRILPALNEKTALYRDTAPFVTQTYSSAKYLMVRTIWLV